MNRAHIARLVLLAMCIGFGWWWYQLCNHRPRHALLPTLPSVFGFIADDMTRTHHQQFNPDLVTARSSINYQRVTSAHEFLVVSANYPSSSGHLSSRWGANSPVYVFEKYSDGWEPVGGFVGSGVRIIGRNGQLIAQEFWHASAAADPPNEYIYHEGSFHHWTITSE